MKLKTYFARHALLICNLTNSMKSILLIALLTTCSPLAAKESVPEIIALWPDGAPGFSKNFSGENTRLDTRHMTEISNPFMRIFPADPTQTTGHALIVLPGGGYSVLADQHEGDMIARHFASKGITSFVICYRVSKKHQEIGYQFPGPLLDARQAIRHIRKNAAEYKIDPHKLGVIGFSAGGHLAGMCATRYSDTLTGEPTSDISVRPDFTALIYPVVSMIEPNTHSGSRRGLLGKNPSKEQMIAASAERRVTRRTPPLFIVHNQFDRVTSLNSQLLTLAATKAKVPCELHLYPATRHGFGIGTPGKDPAAGWVNLLERFIKRQKPAGKQ